MDFGMQDSACIILLYFGKTTSIYKAVSEQFQRVVETCFSFTVCPGVYTFVPEGRHPFIVRPRSNTNT